MPYSNKTFKFKTLWPYLLILLVTSIYFIFLLNDSRYFFFDDFTGFTFSVPRSYWQIIVDSLASRSVDRHKFIGYLITKWLYHRAGTEISHYFLTIFLLHTLNSFLVFKLLKQLTQKTLISTFLSLVYAYRFYLWWFSNIHMTIEGTFFFISLHLWLNYLNHQRLFTLILFTLSYFLAVSSYGPAFLLVPALIPLTLYLKGASKFSRYLKILSPLLIFVLMYFFVFTFTQDSLARFQDNTNPYNPDFSPAGFFKAHAIYLNGLSGQLLPQSVPLTLVFWPAIIFFTLKFRPRLVYWLIAFGFSIAANSFFPQHTMFYYLYPPVIFLLIYFAFLFQEKRWPLLLIIFLLVFNPFYQIYNVAFRLKHPSINFEERAMAIIVSGIETATNKGDNQVKLSNWEVTPNLQHAIDYQAIPLFLSHPKKLDFIYSYSRDTQVLTLIPKSGYNK